MCELQALTLLLISVSLLYSEISVIPIHKETVKQFIKLSVLVKKKKLPNNYW